MSGALGRMIERGRAPVALHPRAQIEPRWQTPAAAPSAETDVEMERDRLAAPQVEPPAPAARPRAERSTPHEPISRNAERRVEDRPAADASVPANEPVRAEIVDGPRAPQLVSTQVSSVRPRAIADFARRDVRPLAAAPEPRAQQLGPEPGPPPALMPTQPAPARAARTAFADSAPGRRDERVAATASVASAPEVHIHIGRVELTALAPHSEKAPAPRARPASLSLDDYLRGQRERRP